MEGTCLWYLQKSAHALGDSVPQLPIPQFKPRYHFQVGEQATFDSAWYQVQPDICIGSSGTMNGVHRFDWSITFLRHTNFKNNPRIRDASYSAHTGLEFGMSSTQPSNQGRFVFAP